MKNTERLGYAWLHADDFDYFCSFSADDVGNGFKAGVRYAFKGIEPNNLSPDAQKIFERMKMRIDDTNNGFDPYAQ